MLFADKNEKWTPGQVEIAYLQVPNQAQTFVFSYVIIFVSLLNSFWQNICNGIRVSNADLKKISH